MSLLTIAFLCLFIRHDINIKTSMIDASAQKQLSIHSIVDIDSLDQVIFVLNPFFVEGDIVEIPVFIQSDDVINALDFSMFINIDNLEFESVVDHTGNLQYAAFLNPNDLKLRFTSNSFTPYPNGSHKVVSIRFRVLTGIVYRTDFQTLITYLNGERCSSELQGNDFILSSEEVEENEMMITPNPASDFINVDSDEEGVLDMFDLQGRMVIRGYRLHSDGLNSIHVQKFPRGSYTVRIISKNHTIKTQKIVLQ